jgi:hypothetical protein
MEGSEPPVEQPPQRRGMPGFGARDAYASPPVLAAGSTLSWLSGLILMLSTFMDWYSGSGDGITIGVTGWHTGTLGKLVFFIGALVVLIAVLREVGIQLPPAVPESLVMIALGSLSTVFVLIRLISIPDEFLPASGRGIGIWISLLASLAVIAAGLLRATEEL